MNVDGVDLQGADLGGATLPGATQNGTITGTPAHLPSGTLLIGGYLLGPDAELNSVPGSPFANSNFTGTGLDLSGAQMQNDDLSGDTFPSGTDFSSANLVGSNFTDDVLSGTDLADLAGADLAYSNLTGTDLSGADLSGLYMSQDQMDGVDLINTNLTGAYVGGIIQNGTFAGTPADLPSGTLLVAGYLVGPYQYLNSIPGSPFADTDFTGSGIDLQNTGLQSDDLSNDPFQSGTDFSSGRLACTNFSGDSLIDADFSSANMGYNNFTNADLDGANFSGANNLGNQVTWSNTTCPDGSNSDTNGSSPPSCIGYGI